MPTINYANSIIYIILDKQTRECYVGSTATSLAKRMYRHRKDLEYYNKWIAGGKQGSTRHGKCASYAILERNQYTSFELERYPCTTKRELRLREGYYIDKYRQDVGALCLNKKREGVNVKDDEQLYFKQHYQANKEQKLAYQKAYSQANKEQIQANNKAHYQANKERIQANYQAKKENRQAYNKAYSQRPYTCPDCNKLLTLGAKQKHLRRCNARKARLQQEHATAESPTTIVPFTNKQPLFVNTEHSVMSSVGLVFA